MERQFLEKTVHLFRDALASSSASLSRHRTDEQSWLEEETIKTTLQSHHDVPIAEVLRERIRSFLESRLELIRRGVALGDLPQATRELLEQLQTDMGFEETRHVFVQEVKTALKDLDLESVLVEPTARTTDSYVNGTSFVLSSMDQILQDLDSTGAEVHDYYAFLPPPHELDRIVRELSDPQTAPERQLDHVNTLKHVCIPELLAVDDWPKIQQAIIRMLASTRQPDLVQHAQDFVVSAANTQEPYSISQCFLLYTEFFSKYVETGALGQIASEFDTTTPKHANNLKHAHVCLQLASQLPIIWSRLNHRTRSSCATALLSLLTLPCPPSGLMQQYFTIHHLFAVLNANATWINGWFTSLACRNVLVAAILECPAKLSNLIDFLRAWENTSVSTTLSPPSTFKTFTAYQLNASLALSCVSIIGRLLSLAQIHTLFPLTSRRYAWDSVQSVAHTLIEVSSKLASQCFELLQADVQQYSASSSSPQPSFTSADGALGILPLFQQWVSLKPAISSTLVTPAVLSQLLHPLVKVYATALKHQLQPSEPDNPQLITIGTVLTQHSITPAYADHLCEILAQMATRQPTRITLTETALNVIDVASYDEDTLKGIDRPAPTSRISLLEFLLGFLRIARLDTLSNNPLNPQPDLGADTRTSQLPRVLIIPDTVLVPLLFTCKQLVTKCSSIILQHFDAQSRDPQIPTTTPSASSASPLSPNSVPSRLGGTHPTLQDSPLPEAVSKARQLQADFLALLDSNLQQLVERLGADTVLSRLCESTSCIRSSTSSLMTASTGALPTVKVAHDPAQIRTETCYSPVCIAHECHSLPKRAMLLANTLLSLCKSAEFLTAILSIRSVEFCFSVLASSFRTGRQVGLYERHGFGQIVVQLSQVALDRLTKAGVCFHLYKNALQDIQSRTPTDTNEWPRSVAYLSKMMGTWSNVNALVEASPALTTLKGPRKPTASLTHQVTVAPVYELVEQACFHANDMLAPEQVDAIGLQLLSVVSKSLTAWCSMDAKLGLTQRLLQLQQPPQRLHPMDFESANSALLVPKPGDSTDYRVKETEREKEKDASKDTPRTVPIVDSLSLGRSYILANVWAPGGSLERNLGPSFFELDADGPLTKPDSCNVQQPTEHPVQPRQHFMPVVTTLSIPLAYTKVDVTCSCVTTSQGGITMLKPWSEHELLAEAVTVADRDTTSGTPPMPATNRQRQSLLFWDMCARSQTLCAHSRVATSSLSVLLCHELAEEARPLLSPHKDGKSSLSLDQHQAAQLVEFEHEWECIWARIVARQAAHCAPQAVSSCSALFSTAVHLARAQGRLHSSHPNWWFSTLFLMTMPHDACYHDMLQFVELWCSATYLVPQPNKATGERPAIKQARLRQVCTMVEALCLAELPCVTAALQLAGSSPSYYASMWLEQCFWNYLNWREISLLLVGTLVHGASFTAVAVLAMFRHCEARILQGSSGGTLDTDLRCNPIRGFSFQHHHEWMQHVLAKWQHMGVDVGASVDVGNHDQAFAKP
eukprot:m.274664 g.274664  ORF g.274664 m.274664 type:complete len:1508 (+) comp15688_c0_seq2:226-4749(+)